MNSPAYLRLHDEHFRARIITLRQAVTPLLAGNYMPMYTDHSVTHADCVCQLIDDLTAPLTEDKRLNDVEAFVLYAAAYLHDAGLQHQRADELDLVKEEIAKRHPGRSWVQLDIDTRRTLVRQLHHRISGEMITASVNAAHPTPLGLEFTEEWHPGLIRSLVVAHNLYMDSHEREIYREMTQDWGKVRMSLLSGLLRLADILDESRRRSQLHLELTRELTLEARMHWWRHYYVKDVEINSRERAIVLWFDFPSARRAQYRQMFAPLQVPEIRSELERQSAVLAPNNLLWHLEVQESPAPQSTSKTMDSELEHYILEKIVNMREQQAQRDRLLVLEELNAARPTIERDLAALRMETNSLSPEQRLLGFLDLARHLYNLGGHRNAWMTLLSEYHKLQNEVSLITRFNVAMELAEMMFADGISHQSMKLLHELNSQTDSASGLDVFRFTALLARGYVEECAYLDALTTLQRAADLAPDAATRESQLALLDEAKFLQGDLLTESAEDSTI